jgi:hypothetical protein
VSDILALVLAALAAGFAGVLFVLIRARRKRRSVKPAREPSAYVILEGNAWDSCTVDDVREPWSRLATEPVRGFCGVGAGRHRVRTSTPHGEATLDFVAYPGELLAFRLDPEHARWEPHDVDAETRASLEATPRSTRDLGGSAHTKLPGWLVHLRTTVDIASSRNVSALDNDGGISRVRTRLEKLVARGESDEVDPTGERLVEARGLGESLIGRRLSKRELHELIAPVREAVNRLVDHGEFERAKHLFGLGFLVLPGDPELMLVAGCALAAAGEGDDALRALDAAIERDRSLSAEDIAHAMRARMDLKGRLLGRRVRV